MTEIDSNKSILVIDDSTTNIVLLQAVLNSKGYSIDTALNVKEAYNSISKKVPDLILLDLLMPRINGFEFLKELKENKEMCEIPVIVVSALTDHETMQKTKNLGALHFVKKPIDIQNIIELVSEVLK